MATFRLVTFGRLALEQADAAPVAVGAQRKTLALLAVIAATGAPGIARERLTALLWPESDAERARGALNQMLHSLRRQLGSVDAVRGTTSLSLDPEQIGSDVVDFRDALAAGDLERVVATYAGAFLDGVHVDGAAELDRWIEAERLRLAESHRAALEGLARAADAREDSLTAVDWWRKAQAADPLNGRIAVALMRSLDAAGDRAGALQHARVHELLVCEEVGAPPDPAVSALAATLVSGAARAKRAGGAERAPAPRRPDERAPESAMAPSAPAAPAHAALPIAVKAIIDRRAAALAAAVVLLLGAGLLATFAGGRLARGNSSVAAAPLAAAPRTGPHRVAVAVFANRTGDARLDPLGIMASDWITRGLAGAALMEVIDVGSLYAQSRTPSGVPTDAHSLARRTGATLVVDGSYYRTGDSVRFSASVVDVVSGRVLRTLDPIAAPTAEPLAAVDELRQRVATGLATILDARVSALLPPAMRPPRYESYQEYVLAQQLYWRGALEAATPHFRRAVALDPAFHVAAVWLAGNAASVGRCELVDSIARSLEGQLDEIGQWERLTLRVQRARCASDWVEHNQLMQARIALQPGSGFNWWGLANGARQLNRPAEAIGYLTSLDPSRDLAWLPDSGKVLYWREVASSRHALGDFDAERAVALRIASGGHGRLAALFVTARALAGAGDADGALAALAEVGTLPAEPSLLAGFIAGHQRPMEVATAGWVLYQIGNELGAHGNAMQGRTALEQSVAWFRTRAGGGPLPPEQRFVWAEALIALDSAREARMLLGPLVREDTADVQRRAQLGVAAALSGDAATARRVARELAGLPARFPIGGPTLGRAQIAAALGDRSAALDLLEALPRGAHPYDFGWLHSDPAFVSLRAEPRFRRLIRPRG